MECVGRALEDLIRSIPSDVLQNVRGVAFDGTSATTMLIDRASGKVLADPKLYNEVQSNESVNRVKVTHYSIAVLCYPSYILDICRIECI